MTERASLTARSGRLVAVTLLAAAPLAWAQGPSFGCAAVEPHSIEALICGDAGLSALDRELAAVYAAALARAGNEHPPVLRAEQRGWIKGRDDCWKSDAVRDCVADSYRLRIAELQARYRLVDGRGPVVFTCGGSEADRILATFFDTDPPVVIAERGDQVALMYRRPSASGARYEGRNESLWEHQGEALVRWGHGGEDMHCLRR